MMEFGIFAVKCTEIFMHALNINDTIYQAKVSLQEEIKQGN